MPELFLASGNPEYAPDTGLVDARPKIGTRVNPRSKWNWLDPDILEWLLQTEPERAVLDALFELRDLVGPLFTPLCSKRRERPLRRDTVPISAISGH